MVLIISKEKLEMSTEQVIDWLEYYKWPFVRLNGDSIQKSSGFSATINNCYKPSINIPGFDCTQEYNIAWFRRWNDDELANELLPFNLNSIQLAAIRNCIQSDQNDCRNALFRLLKVKNWLSRPDRIGSNKLVALIEAKEVGLNIPETIVTGSKNDVLGFAKKFGRIIAKDLSVSYTVFENDQMISSFTTELTTEKLDALPETFLPSKFQVMIEKNYEVRSFFLDGEFYSMAIFSQLDTQTAVDFRIYNMEKPNRNTPYKLSEDIEQKLRKLMDKLKLPTGSIDLIKSPDGTYTFLEVNPIGQFGMTSFPCNYNLEKRIASYLIKMDKANEQPCS